MLVVCFVSVQFTLNDDKNKPVENILFIGNSYTYRNNGVDQALSKLMSVTDQDTDYYFARAAKGKYRLKKHWKDKETLEIFNSRKWDKVILQEYSSGPIKEYDEFVHFGRKWSEKIRKNNPKAEIFLYHTWGYKKTSQMTDSLFLAYQQLGEQINAKVIPIGQLWKKLKGKINLYEKDGAHPNNKGTFLNACMFYAYIFNRDVRKVSKIEHTTPYRNQEKIKDIVHEFRTTPIKQNERSNKKGV